MAETAFFGILERTSPLAGLPILFTIASETLIPILLLVPRTRRWGVVFAASFHYILSLSDRRGGHHRHALGARPALPPDARRREGR